MKKYIKPESAILELAMENIMITASPGVGGDFGDDDPIDAKEREFFDELEMKEALKGPYDFEYEWPR